MRFELHQTIRYDDDSTQLDYLKAIIKYFNTLSRIDFSKAKQLLKFFGNSFFHGGTIQTISISRVTKSMDLIIFREDDREDINALRKTLKLKMISRNQYGRDPVLYRCTFKNLQCFDVSDLSMGTLNSEIIDTEITYDNTSSCFIVAISFGENNEIVLKFKGCKVKVINQNRIFELSGNGMRAIPYCEQCREKLLTKQILNKRLFESQRQLKILSTK